jgi:hypothetical protein
MKTVILLSGFLLFAVPAFASSELILAYCNAQPDPRECIRGFIDQQFEAQKAAQEQWNQRQSAIQLEQARMQANGMALFGAGNALINGMNQGFQHMQQPYVSTPYFTVEPHR